jgi:hypothetical protein
MCRGLGGVIAVQEIAEQVLAASFEPTLAASWITDCARISCACTNYCAQSRMHNPAPCCLCVVLLQAGWNLGACQSCGVNVLTDTNAFDGLGLSADQCYLPPGWGSMFDATAKQLVAYRCNNGTYGVATRIYGVEARPCTVRITYILCDPVLLQTFLLLPPRFLLTSESCNSCMHWQHRTSIDSSMLKTISHSVARPLNVMT